MRQVKIPMSEYERLSTKYKNLVNPADHANWMREEKRQAEALAKELAIVVNWVVLHSSLDKGILKQAIVEAVGK